MVVKMCKKIWLSVLLSVVFTVEAASAQSAVEPEREQRLSGTGSAGTILADIARELISRSGTSSQVLSLNLSNLLILLVLKGILLGVATWGAGAWKGRSVDGGVSPPSTSLLTEAELALLISYLMGETDEKYDCLLRVACLRPKKAREYIAAGQMLIKGAKVMDKMIPVNPKYEKLLEQLQKAVSNEGACNQRFSCSGDNQV